MNKIQKLHILKGEWDYSDTVMNKINITWCGIFIQDLDELDDFNYIKHVFGDVPGTKNCSCCLNKIESAIRMKRLSIK